MEVLNKNTVFKPDLPIKIIQFGEGNFLRAFTDWMVDIMNTEHNYNYGVAVVQPIKLGMVDVLENQDNMYHHIYRGLKEGKVINHTRLIKCIQKSINPFKNIEEYNKLATLDSLEIVISNTTEAGIVFSDTEKNITDLPHTFPGKITKLLWERFNFFNGDKAKGLKFIPVELIEKNGDKLKSAIIKYSKLWKLPEEFEDWINNYNYFSNTLVDRIVTGYPKDEIEKIHKTIGFKDELVVASELFHLFVIEADEEVKRSFPADKFGFNLKYTNDITPYRTQKVRILNGAHTCMVPIGLYNDIETVGDSLNNIQIESFINDLIYKEIIPTINLPESELIEFAKDVIERFKNPFIKHKLTDISLNSISKFRVRVLPTILDFYDKKNTLPPNLIMAFTYLINMYYSGAFSLKDDESILRFFEQLRSKKIESEDAIRDIISNTDFWGQDLNQIDGFYDLILKQYKNLIQN